MDGPEPATPRAARDRYLAGWAELHGGYDPRGNVLVRSWLTSCHTLATPLVRLGAPPDAVTVAGGLLAGAAAGLAAGGDGWWLGAAAAVVVVSAVLDGLDGAVAVRTGRGTRWGGVLDSLVDRVSDLAYVVALWLAGAPGPVCAVAGALMFLLEYARARAGAVGMTEVGVVTVWERPTRVVVTVAFLIGAALLGEPWALLGASAWVGLGLVGLAQLLPVVRRRLA